MAQARIFRPAKTAMQSGRGRTRTWVLEYGPATPRLPDPLMGWASAQDTLNEVHLRFPTLEEAVAFAKKTASTTLSSNPTTASRSRKVTPTISVTTGSASDQAGV
jgi:hypothetical protein